MHLRLLAVYLGSFILCHQKAIGDFTFCEPEPDLPESDDDLHSFVTVLLPPSENTLLVETWTNSIMLFRGRISELQNSMFLSSIGIP